MISKSIFRKVILQYRALLDEEIYLDLNRKLCESITTFIEENKVEKLHTFLAIRKNNEPDISPLFDRFWKGNKQIIVSKTDFKRKQMQHFVLGPKTKVELNKKGIPEPLEAQAVSMHELDAVFIPLLVSDKQGYRIGYGGGYYDRLLQGTNSLKVGLSLSYPVDKILQTEKWDIPLDYLITPYKTYNYGSNNAWRN